MGKCAAVLCHICLDRCWEKAKKGPAGSGGALLFRLLGKRASAGVSKQQETDWKRTQEIAAKKQSWFWFAKCFFFGADRW